MFRRIIEKELYYPKYYYKHIGSRLFVVAAISLLIAILDGLGLTMFLPLLQIADGTSENSLESVGKIAVVFDLINAAGITLTLSVILIFLCTFFISKGIIVYLGNSYKIIVQQYFVKKIRLNMLDAITNISFKAFIKSDTGRIQNTMSGEVSRLSMSLTYYLAALQNIVMVLVYISIAVLINGKFSILVAFGGYLMNFIFKRIYKKTKRESLDLTRESHLYQGLLIQFIANFKYLKATQVITQFGSKLQTQILQIEKNNRKIGMLSSLVSAIREPSMIIVVAIAIFIEIEILGGSLSAILVSLLFFYRALSSILMVQTNWNYFLGVSGSMENMKDFQKNIELKRLDFGSIKFSKFSKSFKLEHSSMYYDQNPVIDNISLEIKKNQSIAFVGESGSGKTTLLNILSGLLPLSEGSYKIDDIDIKEYDVRSLQRKVGYITQEPVIFNGTIFENITIWAEKTEKTMKRFNEIIEKASLLDFIISCDLNEDTVLGNNGINLSGGQRQRISIARELYKEVEILIMDEATSALDSETERAIQTSLDSLKGQYTMLIVAHRLSTIKFVDKIYVMKNGNIIEEGDYEELIKSNSKIFKKMVNLQVL